MSGRRIWRSLEEYQGSDAFGDMLKAEFPSLFELWQVDRRELLRVMGASLALAGMTACKPVRSDSVVPFVNRPQGFLEGRVDHYATAVLIDGYAQPVLATTSAGRPIKLDGNPEHPAFRGGSTAFTQAAILDLYDPDRSQAPLAGRHPASWADFDGQMARWRTAWRANKGAGLRLLIGPTTSPTLLRQVDELRAGLALARVHLFDPLTGYRGEPPPLLEPRFEKAQVIVSLDDDFLGPGPMQAINGRAWGATHGDGPDQARQRLFAAETTPGLAGAKADRRLAIPPSRLPMLAQAVAAAAGTSSAQADLTAPELAWAKRAGRALVSARGRSVLTVGAHCPGHLHALALKVNQALGNVGKTCDLAPQLGFVPGQGETFLDLARDMAAGQVSALFVLDANPVYASPGEIDFAELYKKVPVRVHAGTHVDETAARSSWHLPLSHLLEEWSDARSPDGLATIIQPVVQPLYDTRSLHSIVALLTADTPPYAQDVVKQTWAAQLGDPQAWNNALKLGFVQTPQAAPAQPIAPAAPTAAETVPNGAVEIVFRPDPTIRDGTFAHNAWLQELPKPLFKTVWDNVVAISPALAREMQVDTADVVRVESAGRAVEGPAWILPGQPDRVVTLFLGYGRTRAGRVGTGIGYDAYRMRTAAAPWSAIGKIAKTGRQMILATTQEHHLLEAEGEGLVRTVTPQHPTAAREQDRNQDTLYDPWPQETPAWGMVIDLDRCIGCNACVAACQAENNVPVVGKDQVHRGREMHWLRVDRYYAGTPEEPDTMFQPVPCMHCEQAPCEMGCPVHATVHSPEGLNLMVYNRCIGTRTCSSYCPYKVRRFNWFDYTSAEPESIAMQRNPDVTVRGRGVMEKCTYCIQRIEGAKVQADIENRAVREGEIKTACQQACPAEAISFGNLADRRSAVRKQRSSPRNYALLAELGTRPRTTYLARVRDDEDGDGE
ncbi:MAG TPA: TAT-variant-translocated molybdopterin oxidoreductase [Sphingomicrobium sp.]|nr:TAT-variant-translocated molybdopterin oxidoreductase [Sphingomicrobium sp.]